MIVKNEEDNLQRCLESVKDIVDEMIIVDTGSTDDTVKIAKSYGAKVFYFQWNGNFSDARNYAFEKAKGNWIMRMDADEELSATDREKVLPLLNNSDVDVYVFQTLNYTDNISGIETITNLNIRLIRNHKGYKYKNAIHEQLYKSMDSAEQKKFVIEKIVVYHYGYLNTMTMKKNKPSRNMKILENILEKDPNNNFHLYNMGNEYLRLGKYKKALEYYKKVYKKINPDLFYTPKLLAKMMLALDRLKMYEEEMEVLNTGLKYYPKFTDLEYQRACLFHKQKKYSLAIKGLKKCIKMGEPPVSLKTLNDVGGYRAYYALAEIYSKLGDYDEAYNYYIETIKAKSNYHMPLYRIAENLEKRGKEINVMKARLERFFGKSLNEGAYAKLGDIFYGIEKYDVSLEYFLKAQEIVNTDKNLYYCLGLTQMHLKNYEEAYKWFEKVEEGDRYEQAIYKMILCDILSNNMENAEKLLGIANTFESKNMTIVYKSFKNLVEDKECEIISNDKEESKEFLDIIFILLNLIIKVSTPEIFEKSRQLLNLIDNDEASLKLAKLYYNKGYSNLAYQEFIRSIKLFDKIDKEGLEMMGNILDIPSSVTI
ncbi:hypothetical protein CCE28_03735 [Anaeromicrobium sediminis]|uniref:Glycosyltransferase 2-like domain-containing protein n=2 Tax=Anaeromicrobium sediminis TaxID=1478221 RepID=A0A267MPC6_9FIRM|nr:hypothetical protein CCE28_03735 [Anaeromicrobium sediminis]